MGLVFVDGSYEEDLVGFKGRMMRWWEEATGRPVPPFKTSGPMHESDFPTEVRERAERASGQCNRVNVPPFDKLPSAAQQARTWACSQARTHLPGESTFDGDEAAALRVERQKLDYPLDNKPLVVVSRGISGYEREPMPEQREAERHVHAAELAKLSRVGKQVTAEGSGHQVHIDAPDVVVNAIRDVVSAVRER
jgi:pimeloyl-ACP methyl ester carboxylesterase